MIFSYLYYRFFFEFFKIRSTLKKLNRYSVHSLQIYASCVPILGRVEGSLRPLTLDTLQHAVYMHQYFGYGS